jgi:predicted transposase/invertase (TIGR01784 family)
MSEKESMAKPKPLLHRVMTVEDVFRQYEEERPMREQREKGLNDFYNAMSTAEERGRLKGLQKTLGIHEGRLAMARWMLAEGNVSPGQVAEFTGLPVEQVRALRKES